MKQLELVDRAGLSLPEKEDGIDFSTYSEFKERIDETIKKHSER